MDFRLFYFIGNSDFWIRGKRSPADRTYVRSTGEWTFVHFFERYALVAVIEFQELHFMITLGTIQGVISEGEKNRSSPLSEAAVYLVFFSGNDAVQF